MAWKGVAAAGALAAALAGGAAVVVTAPAPAPAARREGPPAEALAEAPRDSGALVAARQETMQRMEAVWLLLSEMIGQGDDLDRPAAMEGASVLAGLFREMQRQYPEGSFAPPSQALPDVRTDWAAFTGLAEDAQRRAEVLGDALASGSPEEARDALSAVEKDCSACHLRFSPGIRTDLRPWPPERP